MKKCIKLLYTVCVIEKCDTVYVVCGQWWQEKSMLKSKQTQYKTFALLKNASNEIPNHLTVVDVTKY